MVYCYRKDAEALQSQGALQLVDSMINVPKGTTKMALAFVGLVGLILAARAQLRTSKYEPIEDPAEI